MKGFLFVLTVFLILTYILLSVSVWVKAIEASERSYSEFYKESNVELAVAQITPQKVDAVSNTVLNRALFVLNNYSIDHPFNAGDPGDESHYVAAAFGEWLQNGSPASSDFVDGTVPSEPSSSMESWASGLNGSLAATGVLLDEFRVYNFTLTQANVKTLVYSFKADLKMRDKAGTTSVIRTYDITNSLDITGIPDPAIARSTKSAGPGKQIAGRVFVFSPSYNNADDLAPKLKGASSGGKGWFYGYLTTPSDSANVNASERGDYIMVGSYADIVAAPYHAEFGAYIVNTTAQPDGTCTVNGVSYTSEKDTFNPVKYGANCDPQFNSGKGEYTPNPFIISTNFDMNDTSLRCPDLVNRVVDRKCALFVTATDLNDSDPLKTRASPGGVYNVESARDFTLCGYYTHDPLAPSYMQRLLGDAYNRSSADFGISTFLVGQYVNETVRDSYSMLDREMLKTSPTPLSFHIRGMPGCKDQGMCSDDPSTGVFGLSTGSISAFGFGSISCDPSTGARCD